MRSYILTTQKEWNFELVQRLQSGLLEGIFRAEMEKEFCKTDEKRIYVKRWQIDRSLRLYKQRDFVPRVFQASTSKMAATSSFLDVATILEFNAWRQRWLLYDPYLPARGHSFVLQCNS